MSNHRSKSNSDQTKNPYSTNFLFDVFNSLLTRMLKNIKADKAVLVSSKKGVLQIEAEAFFNAKEGAVAKSIFQIQSQRTEAPIIPEAIVQSALNSGKQIIVDQPTQEQLSDSYFKENQPSFIFCSPLCLEPSDGAVLYLESCRPLAMKKKERTTLLSLWADQASLSLENTKWFSVLQEDLKDRVHEISEVKKENRARIRFLADMNHEVMAPLNSIMGFSQLLMRKDSQLHFPPEVRRYLERIQSSGSKLAELLEKVLEYSRIGAGNKELVKEDIDVRLLLNSIYLANRQLLQNRGITLEVDLEEQCPETLYADRSMLVKILMALVKFVIFKASGEHTVRLKASGHKGNLQFALTDVGDPISPADHKNLFAAGFCDQQNAVDSDSSIDLVVAKQLVEELQGDLTYRTTNHQNAEIVVTIPGRAYVADDAISSWKAKKHFMEEYRVLLLEDHQSDWELLTSILKDLEVTTLLKPFSPGSFPDLVSFNPHLIFIDTISSGKDEKTDSLVRFLGATSELADIRLVATTTETPPDKYRSRYLATDIEYITKPFGVGDVIHLLQRNSNRIPVENPEKEVSDEPRGNSASLPDGFLPQSFAIDKLIAKDLEKLVSIPIYKGGTIISRLNQIKEDHHVTESECLSLIRNLKSAVFNGDAETYLTLLRQAIAGKPR